MSSVYLEIICYKKISVYCPRLDLIFNLPIFDIPRKLTDTPLKIQYEDRFYAKIIKHPETYALLYSLWKMWLFAQNLQLHSCRKQFTQICNILRKNPPFITMLPNAMVRFIDVCRRLKIHNKTHFTSKPIYITQQHKFSCSICSKEVTGDICLFRRCKCSDYIIHEKCKFTTCQICDEKIHKY